MNLQWLYYFRTIAELEHYTRAAEKLHVSQSNLSHAIKELETELGAQLFERKGRNIRLTKYGLIFRPYVEKTLETLETGVTTLKDYIDPDIGTISMSGFQSMAQFATELMVRYQSDTGRTGVQFQYSQEGWADINKKLLEGTVDLVLSTKVDSPQVEGTYIGNHPLVVIVPEKHRFVEQKIVHLSELDHENFIAFDRSGQLRGELDKHFKSISVSPNIVSETANDQIIYGLVAADRGVAVVPYPLGGAPFGTKVLPIADDISQRKIYLQWNNTRYIPPAAEYFRDYVMRNEDVFNQYLRLHQIPL